MVTLVTGAGGFLGAALCRRLFERGESVVGLWHDDNQRLETLRAASQHAGSGFHPIQGDIEDPDAWISDMICLGPIETVFHLATQPPTPPGVERTTNVEGTLALVRALENDVTRWINTSSMSVYDFQHPQYLPVDEDHPPGPLQAYGEEKLRAEQILIDAAQRGASVITLRLCGLFGPGRDSGAAYTFVRSALQGDPIDIPINRGIDILHVDDAVTALMLAADQLTSLCPDGGSRRFNIGRGEPTALDELARLASVAAGRSVEIRCGEEGSCFYLDIAAAAADLGFSPTPLAQGLEDIASCLQRSELALP